MSEVARIKCCECHLELPPEEFITSDGRGGWRQYPRCHECRRRYAREYYHQNKARIMGARKARRNGDAEAARQLSVREQKARQEASQPDHKKCPRCARLGRESLHPKSEFGANRSSADGLRHWCMRCTNEDKAERRESFRALGGWFIVTRVGGDLSQQPVDGASLVYLESPSISPDRRWLIRLKRDKQLREFLLKHAPVTVRPAPDGWPHMEMEIGVGSR